MKHFFQVAIENVEGNVRLAERIIFKPSNWQNEEIDISARRNEENNKPSSLAEDRKTEEAAIGRRNI